MAFNIQTANGVPVQALARSDGASSLSVSEALSIGGTTQVLTLSATAQASSAWGSGNGAPVQLRIIGTQPFYITAGTNPVATSASPYFPSGVDRTISVADGQKVSVVQAGSAGNVWISTT